MNKVTIFHNPKCSKSRATLQILQDKGADITVVEYLKNPPTIEKLQELSTKLSLPVSEFIRKKEPIFQELNLKNADERALLQAISLHPTLLERPIVEKNQKAVIGRPPENVLEIL